MMISEILYKPYRRFGGNPVITNQQPQAASETRMERSDIMDRPWSSVLRKENRNMPKRTARIPPFRMPKAGAVLTKWAVIACGQYSSQPDIGKSLVKRSAMHPQPCVSRCPSSAWRSARRPIVLTAHDFGEECPQQWPCYGVLFWAVSRFC